MHSDVRDSFDAARGETTEERYRIIPDRVDRPPLLDEGGDDLGFPPTLSNHDIRLDCAHSCPGEGAGVRNLGWLLKGRKEQGAAERGEEKGWSEREQSRA